MELNEFYEYQKAGLPFGQPAITEQDILLIEYYEERDEIIECCKFYKEAIEHNSYYLRFPCNVLFHADQYVNAKATVYRNKGLVVWYFGLLFKQLNILKEEEENKIIEGFKETKLGDSGILNVLDCKPNRLFYQINQHFTFYHEFAHIIQQQGKLEDVQYKFQEGKVDFDINKHLLEKDADNFAALCLMTHIVQYADRIFNNQWGKDEITNLLAFYSIPVLIYSMELNSDEENPDTFFEGTHPHPMCRLMFVLLVFIEYFNQQNRGFKIDSKSVFDLTLEVASKISGFDYQKFWVENYTEFMDYNKATIDLKVPMGYESAVDKWNETLKINNV